MKKKLTVIVITPLTLDECLNGWEYDYIFNDLFENFELDIKLIWNKFDLFIENSLIIYSSDEKELNPKIKQYFESYKNKNVKFNLFHLSNEQINHNFYYYNFANVVIRNYYIPNFKYKNVITVPLGYKGGFNKKKPLLKYSEKKYDFCFVGQLKSDRMEVLTHMQKYNKKYVHLTKKWNCPTALNSDELYKIYSETLLIPCPMGSYNYDSFRICEALESGSIPVVKIYDDINYFKFIFGDNPIPIVNEWSELDNLYKKIILNPDDEILKINTWYLDFKNKLKIKLYNLF
jgi:hypothetical protein